MYIYCKQTHSLWPSQKGKRIHDEFFFKRVLIYGVSFDDSSLLLDQNANQFLV